MPAMTKKTKKSCKNPFEPSKNENTRLTQTIREHSRFDKDNLSSG